MFAAPTAPLAAHAMIELAGRSLRGVSRSQEQGSGLQETPPMEAKGNHPETDPATSVGRPKPTRELPLDSPPCFCAAFFSRRRVRQLALCRLLFPALGIASLGAPIAIVRALRGIRGGPRRRITKPDPAASPSLPAAWPRDDMSGRGERQECSVPHGVYHIGSCQSSPDPRRTAVPPLTSAKHRVIPYPFSIPANRDTKGAPR